MTTLRIDWEYDPEDDVTRHTSSSVFFAAWVNQFGQIEYTAVPEDDDRWDELMAVMADED